MEGVQKNNFFLQKTKKKLAQLRLRDFGFVFQTGNIQVVWEKNFTKKKVKWEILKSSHWRRKHFDLCPKSISHNQMHKEKAELSPEQGLM